MSFSRDVIVRTGDLPCASASSSWLRTALAVFGGALAMCLAAQIKFPIPGTPVPATLQSLGMLIIGMTLTPSAAFGAMAVYLLAGTAGLPVFAAAASGIIGPTSGYLIGFLVGAPLIALLRGSGAGAWRMIWSGAAALIALFALGVVWLAVWTGASVPSAVLLGAAPFAVKALIELPLAVSAALIVSRLGARGRVEGSFLR